VSCDCTPLAKNTSKAHIKSKHVKVRNPCDKCEFSATRAHDLKEHIRTIHEIFRHLCDKCEQRFEFEYL